MQVNSYEGGTQRIPPPPQKKAYYKGGVRWIALSKKKAYGCGISYRKQILMITLH